MSVFIIAAIAMIGSLYYSEIRGLTPCILCWYQRILMYPLVAITAVGLWKRDMMMPRYVLSMSIVGILVSGYHYSLQMFKPAAVNAFINCTKYGVSCTTVDISYYGFITIPLLSFIAFVSITCLMLFSFRVDRW